MEHRLYICLIIVGSLKQFYKMVIQIHIATRRVLNILFSHMLVNFLAQSISSTVIFVGGEWCWIMTLICIFQMTEVEHLLIRSFE